MKHSIAVIVLIAALAPSSPSIASKIESTLAAEDADGSRAAIRSRGQLDKHLRTAPKSPLYKLGAARMKSFVASLVFTEKGLGSYSFVDLEGMPVSDVRGILGLFGLQDDAGVGRSAASVAQEGGRVSRSRSKRSPPRWGQTCIVSPGGRVRPHCISADGFRCSSVCR
jgi:hypothetical protein